MSAVEILLAVAGTLVTTLVIVAMILVTPRSGIVEVHVEGTEGRGQGSELSPQPTPERRRPEPART